jgi:hypothetical protein
MPYESGRGFPQSCNQAAKWVTRAAENGNAAAEYNLCLRTLLVSTRPLNSHSEAIKQPHRTSLILERRTTGTKMAVNVYSSAATCRSITFESDG